MRGAVILVAARDLKLPKHVLQSFSVYTNTTLVSDLILKLIVILHEVSEILGSRRGN